MIILHPFSLMQEIQHHENCLRPAIQGYSAIFFFPIHFCSECFGLLVRCPFWTSNSTEAENCTKNEQMRKLICCWRTVIFCDYKVSIHVNKLCIKRKTTIMVQRSSMMYFIIPLRTSALAQYS